jgi:carbon-monoxide dehydrogenase medium subunit
MVGLAACASDAGESLCDLRLAYFGVGSIPVRARKAEAALMDGDLDGAVDLLGEDLHPSDDIQASAAVKLHLAGVLLRRVAKQLTTPQTLERRA